MNTEQTSKNIFTYVIGVPAGLASAYFALVFSLAAGIINKLLKITRKKKKKHNNIAILANFSSINRLGHKS